MEKVEMNPRTRQILAAVEYLTRLKPERFKATEYGDGRYLILREILESKMLAKGCQPSFRILLKINLENGAVLEGN